MRYATANHRWMVPFVVFILLVGLSAGCGKSARHSGNGWRQPAGTPIRLPKPEKRDGMPLPQALSERRSHREFSKTALTNKQLSQLCWSAQGISSDTGHRTAPSAGGLYPITIVVADENGVYEYRPDTHALVPRGKTDVRARLQKAGLNQSAIGDAPACFVVTFDVSVTAEKYGSTAERYCLLEAGHVAQNLLLTATSIKLNAVPIGALYEKRVSKALGLPDRLRAAYLIPIGNPR